MCGVVYIANMSTNVPPVHLYSIVEQVLILYYSSNSIVSSSIGVWGSIYCKYEYECATSTPI